MALRAFNGKKRPKPQDRRQMVRVIVEEMVKYCPNPKLTHVKVVAKKICQKYPESFRDEFSEGTDLTNESEGLSRQLRARVENVNHGNPVTTRILVPVQPAANRQQVIKRKAADSYGCILWQPQFPPNESEEMQTSKWEALQKLHCDGRAVYVKQTETIECLMEATYPSQRKDINGPPALPVNVLRTIWPFLFEPRYLFGHFQTLVGIDIQKVLPRAVEKQKPRFVSYFRSLSGKSKQPVQGALRELDSLLDSCEDKKQCEAAGFLHIIRAYFGEPESCMFYKADVTDTPEDLEGNENIPHSPTLIGDHFLTCNSFLISVDQVVVCRHSLTFMPALCAFFSLFYVLNVQYPEDAGTTMDFIQRCLVGINPDCGTKTPKVVSGGKKKTDIRNPRVLTLTRSVSDYEMSRYKQYDYHSV